MKTLKQRAAEAYYRIWPRDTNKYYLNRREDFWVRHLSDEWANHPSKRHLADAISNLLPSSVLEIGCNAGANLLAIHRLNPNFLLHGVELNINSVEYGNEKLSPHGITLRCGDILSPKFDAGVDSFDIVFTNALLVLFDRNKVKLSLERMARLGNRFIILLEWHSDKVHKNKDKIYHGLYVQNYHSIISGIPGLNLVSINKIPRGLWDDDGWLQYGHLITISIEK